MSNYVDVLAVMDRNIVFAERTGSAEDLENAREARSNVAELINRDNRLNAAISEFQSALGIEGASALPFSVRNKLDAMLNLANAQAASLARVTGGAE